MSWNILQNSTTADAADVMDNFYHVGQGTITPKASTTMVNVSDTYDIGSSATAWKDLHCKDIDIETEINSKNNSIWTLEVEHDLTTTATVISITGLNGDDYTEMMIIGKLNHGVTSGGDVRIGFNFNQDTSGNYGYQVLTAFDTAITAVRTDSSGSMLFAQMGNTSTSMTFCKHIIYTKTGHERLGVGTSLNRSYGKTVYGLWYMSNIWSNSTDTITSIQIHPTAAIGYMGTGTHIEIWKRG